MANLRDVANEAGVSVATASRVLNRGKGAEMISQACAERVRAVAASLGYTRNYHHRSIRLGKAETVGFVRSFGRHAAEDGQPGQVMSTSDRYIRSMYFNELIGGVETTTIEAGYNLALIGPDDHHRALVRGMNGIRERRLDGLVMPTPWNLEEERGPVENSELPVVVIQPQVDTKLPTVDFDQQAALKMAVEHLAELGHRELLWLGPVSDYKRSGCLRESLFVTAAWDAGVKGASCRFDVDYDKRSTDVEWANKAEEAMAEALTGDATFTGIVCYNDQTALSALRVLMDKGISVPDQVSVIGIDNTQSRYSLLPLTSIDHRFTEMGRAAGKLILELIDGGKEAVLAKRGYREILPPKLAARQTTGPVAS